MFCLCCPWKCDCLLLKTVSSCLSSANNPLLFPRRIFFLPVFTGHIYFMFHYPFISTHTQVYICQIFYTFMLCLYFSHCFSLSICLFFPPLPLYSLFILKKNNYSSELASPPQKRRGFGPPQSFLLLLKCLQQVQLGQELNHLSYHLPTPSMSVSRKLYQSRTQTEIHAFPHVILAIQAVF